MTENTDTLRVNSIIKHFILRDYLPTWASVLGKYHNMLNYFDCYAGPGKYYYKEQPVDGSPVIAVKEFKKLIEGDRRNKPTKINLLFIEKDDRQRKKLEDELKNVDKIPLGLIIKTKNDIPEKLLEDIIRDKKIHSPSFFFIDPYGHPHLQGRSATK